MDFSFSFRKSKNEYNGKKPNKQGTPQDCLGCDIVKSMTFFLERSLKLVQVVKVKHKDHCGNF